VPISPRPNAAACAVLLSLAACSSSGNGDGTITVRGAVVSAAGGPVEGARVVVPGRPEATTGADGRFAISGVRAPYTLVAVKAGAQDRVAIYEGLRRADPVIAVAGQGTVRTSAMPDGTLLDYAPVDGAEVEVQCRGPEVNGWSMTVDGAGAFPSPDYGFPITWEGPWEVAVRCTALQLKATDGLPSEYVAFWSTTGVALASGVSPDAVSLTSTAVSSREVSLSFDPAAGTSILHAQAAVRFEDPWAHRLPWFTPTAQVAYRAPVLAGGTFQVALTSETADHDTVTTALDVPEGASSVTVATPAALALQSPAPDAELALSTAFSWSAAPGAVHVLRLSSPSGPLILLVTASASATLDRLADAGVTLPASEPYVWSIEAYAPLADVDAYATRRALRDLDWLGAGYAPFPAGATRWTTNSRAATVAP
jgi:hypothetical protein